MTSVAVSSATWIAQGAEASPRLNSLFRVGEFRAPSRGPARTENDLLAWSTTRVRPAAMITPRWAADWTTVRRTVGGMETSKWGADRVGVRGRRVRSGSGKPLTDR
jgi:hypothetical protein